MAQVEIALRKCYDLALMASAKRAFSLDDLFSFTRFSQPEISPDGKSVLYVAATPDVTKNVSLPALWVSNVDGKNKKQIVSHMKGLSSPRWSPDGKGVVFISSQSGKPQVWSTSVSGGEAELVTDMAHGVSSFTISKSGKHFAFVASVWTEFSSLPFAESNQRNRDALKATQENPVKVLTHTRLFYRHWDSYTDETRFHVFIANAEWSSGRLHLSSPPKDLTPWDRDSRPNSSTFTSGDEITFSPDDKFIFYTSSPHQNEAWSTDFHVSRISVSGGEAERVFPERPGANNRPMHSSDGKWLACRSQTRPTNEADKWQLMVRPTSGGELVSLNASWDYSIEDFEFSKQKPALYFLAQHRGRIGLYEVSLESENITELITQGSVESFTVGPNDEIAFLYSDIVTPAEVRVRRSDGSVVTITDENHERLASLELRRPQSTTIKGADGDDVQMWTILPPNFDEKKKWSSVFMVHGGPQSAFMDIWSTRWNASIWAAQGYVIFQPNARGSSGFGERFKDQVSQDWGGRVYEDLMAAADYCDTLPFIDKERMAAAGASFGGYMMNWFEGHTDRFKTLINHCGIYNLESMLVTEELWFLVGELGGLPWDNREIYEKFSPHRFTQNFKTPMLIIHNESDYRCPIGEGYQVFHALQRKGIPSRFVNFTEEGHWVVKPGNSRRWHEEVFTWLKKFI